MKKYKAVLVSEDNVNSLSEQYNQEPDLLEEHVGDYLVADFGASFISGFFAKIDFEMKFMRTSAKLANGYFEAVDIRSIGLKVL